MASLTQFPWWRRWFGSRSEKAVGQYLQSLGHRILIWNFTCKLGEIDLITLDGQCIVFVEVRSTESANATRPAESVGRAKQRKLSLVARYFMQRRRLTDCSARFDVVVVSWPNRQKEPAIQHFPNAFEVIE